MKNCDKPNKMMARKCNYLHLHKYNECTTHTQHRPPIVLMENISQRLSTDF